MHKTFSFSGFLFIVSHYILYLVSFFYPNKINKLIPSFFSIKCNFIPHTFFTENTYFISYCILKCYCIISNSFNYIFKSETSTLKIFSSVTQSSDSVTP